MFCLWNAVWIHKEDVEVEAKCEHSFQSLFCQCCAPAVDNGALQTSAVLERDKDTFHKVLAITVDVFYCLIQPYFDMISNRLLLSYGVILFLSFCSCVRGQGFFFVSLLKSFPHVLPCFICYHFELLEETVWHPGKGDTLTARKQLEAVEIETEKRLRERKERPRSWNRVE